MSWGGVLRFGASTANDDVDGWELSPFTAARVHWRRKQIEVLAPAETAKPGDVIHEVGHVFAARRRPHVLEDESVFLGWEILIAKLLGVLDRWRDGNDYQIDTKPGYFEDIRHLSAAKFSSVARAAIARGATYGNIVRMQPVSVRRRAHGQHRRSL